MPAHDTRLNSGGLRSSTVIPDLTRSPFSTLGMGLHVGSSSCGKLLPVTASDAEVIACTEKCLKRQVAMDNDAGNTPPLNAGKAGPPRRDGLSSFGVYGTSLVFKQKGIVLGAPSTC